MKTRLFLSILIIQANLLLGQHYLIWEPTGKNSTHGENNYLLNQITHNQLNAILKPSLFKENTKGRKIAGIGYRFLKFALLDAQLDYFSVLSQHEAFGHGAYYREYGYENNMFNMNLAPPYGNGSGIARRGVLKKPRQMGRHEAISIEYGGSESSSVLGDIVLKKWVLNGEIEFDESVLFAGGKFNISAYLISSDYNNKIRGDMLDYIDKINYYHGYSNRDQFPLQLSFLKKMALVNLLNPIYLYNMYAYTVNYIGKGNERTNMPFIHVLGYQYLPSFGMNLNPFGSELVMVNYLRNDRHLLTAEVRIGDNKLAKSNGGSLSYSQIWSDKPFQFDANFDIWNQDVLELGGNTLHTTRAGWGGAARFSANFRLLKGEKPLYWHTQLGYKTNGYLQGQYLKQGLIWRVGLSFQGI